MQAWAKRCGGASAALARPEVPAEEGSPLRLGIGELLNHPVSSKTAYKAGYDYDDAGWYSGYEDYCCSLRGRGGSGAEQPCCRLPSLTSAALIHPISFPRARGDHF